MNKQVIFNLPVKDLGRSRDFFAAVGFSFSPQYSSEDTAYMVIAEGSIHAMLMTEDFFKSLTGKAVVQAREANEVIICLTCESRGELDSLIAKALASGGSTPHPAEDHGFMYTQGFEDLDGHLWNLVWTARNS
jgi:predicted lactoylglutathione lyase